MPIPDRVPRYYRIQLPCGFAFASVTKDIKPETIKALDEMARTVMQNIDSIKSKHSPHKG